MGSMNAFYIRAADAGRIDSIRTAYPKAYTEAGSEFLAVEKNIDADLSMGIELRRLSDELQTEVIWMQFSSVTDSFMYLHWDRGELIRALIFGCFEREREWERAEGREQPWEGKVIFGDLEGAMRFVDDEAERQRIRGVFERRLIEVGNDCPQLDGRETARGVADFYQLPGWN
jgi:hypothetical protein